MTIPLVFVLTYKYPDIDLDSINPSVALADHGTGKGPVISVWNVSGIEQPTEEQLAVWQEDPEILVAYKKQQNKLINQPIYDQLDALDIKSIRAIRENNTVRIQALEAEAVLLRAKLL